MNKVSLLLKAAADHKVTRALIGMQFKGYLKEVGWVDSFREQMPIDDARQPIPWITYPTIDFIRPRLNNHLLLFEYGSGNSTLFYAKYVKQVYAVENDSGWFSKISKSLPANAKVFYQELERDGAYSRYAAKPGLKFDIIVVDGRDRVNCCKHALNALTSRGVIVLDDTERPEYEPARKLMLDNDFREIPFWGMAPGLGYRKCTSVFYRTNNCLGI